VLQSFSEASQGVRTALHHRAKVIGKIRAITVRRQWQLSAFRLAV
jgi:hypothetical protein